MGSYTILTQSTLLYSSLYAPSPYSLTLHPQPRPHPQTISLDKAVPPSGTSAAQFDSLSDLVSPSVALFLLFKLDPTFGSSDSGKWLVVSWIPDDVRVRDKMLYSSSRSHLKNTLGLTNFVEKDYNVSDADELTQESYRASLFKVSTLNEREEGERPSTLPSHSHNSLSFPHPPPPSSCS